MKRHGFLAPLANFIQDKRRDNHSIPFDTLMALGVTAKLKLKTSLTDVPFAVNDAELLSELGWNAWDNGRDVNEGLFSEGVMRKLIGKYTSEKWISFYNHYVQDCVTAKPGMQPCIHILDCTNLTSFIRKLRKKIEPDPDNPQYIVTVWGVGCKFAKEKPCQIRAIPNFTI